MKHNKLKLREILCAFKTKKSILIIVILSLGLAIYGGIAGKFFTKPQYELHMQLLVEPPKSQSSNEIYINQSAIYSMEINTCTQILKSDDLIQNTINDIGSNETLKTVSKNLSIQAVGDSKIINVSYKGESNSQIIELLNSLQSNFIAKVTKLFPGTVVKVIGKPMPSQQMLVSVNRAMVMDSIVGLIIGLILSIGIVLLIECLDNTVKNREILEEELGLSVLAVVPHSDGR